MSDAFHYIGIAVCVAVAVGAIFVAAVIAHDRLIRDRFSWIPFRKGERRLSIASWHSSKLVNRDNDREDDWPADDWPIGERPFYLSMKIGKRRLFILAGTMTGPRGSAMFGRHPENERLSA